LVLLRADVAFPGLSVRQHDQHQRAQHLRRCWSVPARASVREIVREEDFNRYHNDLPLKIILALRVLVQC
jgi:hypothetical protein